MQNSKTVVPIPTEFGAQLAGDTPVTVRAYLVSERLHLRGLYESPLEYAPLAVPAGASGLAMLFRYGAVVLFNLSDSEQKVFLEELRPRMERPLVRLETEDTRIFVSNAQSQGAVADGIGVSDLSLPRLKVIAIVLARSVALQRYEATMAGAFDVIEPLAQQIEREGGGARILKSLLRHIGGTLLVQARMIGRVEIQDKPDLLWDQPDLERLYLRLETEYELRERNTVLERKLALISNTAQTTLNLLHNRRMLRVEWYIVILIVIEVVLYSYEIWMKHRGRTGWRRPGCRANGLIVADFPGIAATVVFPAN